MQKSHVDIIMYLFCLNENHCGKKKKKKKIYNNIAIRIAGKVSRYIDASMNRATPTAGRDVVENGYQIFSSNSHSTTPQSATIDRLPQGNAR